MFDNLLFHCSTLSNIMTDPRGKSNSQLYNELFEKTQAQKSKFNSLEMEYYEIENKETQKANAKLEAMIKAGDKRQSMISELERLNKIKDEVLLSDTCKRHLIRIFVKEKYDRIFDIKNKYYEKGKLLEEDAITVYSRLLGQYHEKNTEVRSNEYIIGEMDFTDPSVIRINDTKVSWNIFTFFDSAVKELEDMYYWQAQGYMSLWNLKKAKIVKVLLNTPEKLIRKEENMLFLDFIGSEEEWEQAKADLRKQLTYDDIPMEERVIEIPVERNDEDIARIPKRVEECRTWLNNFAKDKVGKMFERDEIVG
jgi:hypothetical protein